VGEERTERGEMQPQMAPMEMRAEALVPYESGRPDVA
jgi:hypothetical protein